MVLSVAGDWAFIPSDWKAIDGEDPLLGIPTTYYGAVQLIGRGVVVSEPADLAGILRTQLADLEPGTPVADPLEAHAAQAALHPGCADRRRGGPRRISSMEATWMRPTGLRSSSGSGPAAAPGMRPPPITPPGA